MASSFTPQQADEAVREISERSTRREQELENRSPVASSSSESEPETPYIDGIRMSKEPQAFMKACRFTFAEFNQLADILREFVLSNWNTGRGRRSSFHWKDVSK